MRIAFKLSILICLNDGIPQPSSDTCSNFSCNTNNASPCIALFRLSFNFFTSASLLLLIDFNLLLVSSNSLLYVSKLSLRLKYSKKILHLSSGVVERIKLSNHSCDSITFLKKSLRVCSFDENRFSSATENVLSISSNVPSKLITICIFLLVSTFLLNRKECLSCNPLSIILSF